MGPSRGAIGVARRTPTERDVRAAGPSESAGTRARGDTAQPAAMVGPAPVGGEVIPLPGGYRQRRLRPGMPA